MPRTIASAAAAVAVMVENRAMRRPVFVSLSLRLQIGRTGWPPR